MKIPKKYYINFIKKQYNIAMKFRLKLFKKNLKYFFLDHKYLHEGMHHAYTLILCLASALIFSIGLNCFINLNEASYPPAADGTVFIHHLATGGASGISQCFVLIVKLFSSDLNISYQLMQSIFYFCLNIPLLIFSFLKLGWKFSLYTTLNVAFVSLFLNFLDPSMFNGITKFIADSLLSRAILAGICTGISIAIAFKGGHSAGGVDIVAYYLSVKKSTSAGKYIVLINCSIIILFSLLTLIESKNYTENLGSVIITACFSVVYQFVGSIVTDTIDVRNKKVLLQIITSNISLSRIIIANVPHSCTIVEGKGGYTGNPKQIIYSVVSNSEVQKLVKEIRRVDDTSFINAMNLNQVYGRFYIKRAK